MFSIDEMDWMMLKPSCKLERQKVYYTYTVAINPKLIDIISN